MTALVSPFGPARLPRKSAGDLATALKVFGDPARLMILNLLHRNDTGLYVAELVELLGFLSQPTVTHHLNILVRAGLVDRVKNGIYVVHRLNPARMTELADLLKPGSQR